MTGREIDEKTKRLKILEPDEIETLYGLPVFDDEGVCGVCDGKFTVP